MGEGESCGGSASLSIEDIEIVTKLTFTDGTMASLVSATDTFTFSRPEIVGPSIGDASIPIADVEVSIAGESCGSALESMAVAVSSTSGESAFFVSEDGGGIRASAGQFDAESLATNGGIFTLTVTIDVVYEGASQQLQFTGTIVAANVNEAPVVLESSPPGTSVTVSLPLATDATPVALGRGPLASDPEGSDVVYYLLGKDATITGYDVSASAALANVEITDRSTGQAVLNTEDLDYSSDDVVDLVYILADGEIDFDANGDFDALA